MAITKRKSKGIVSWPEEERPRERLLTRGPEALTDAELIAILIRVGYKGTSAVELGRQVLKRFGSLRAMVEAPVIALHTIAEGIGRADFGRPALVVLSFRGKDQEGQAGCRHFPQ